MTTTLVLRSFLPKKEEKKKEEIFKVKRNILKIISHFEFNHSECDIFSQTEFDSLCSVFTKNEA